MIEGVEILSQTEIWASGYTMLILLGIIPLLVGAILAINGTQIGSTGEIVVGAILLVIAVIGMTIGGIKCKPTGRYEYKVTISDQVNFNEFNEKYEIISQEGKIYTIREKE